MVSGLGAKGAQMDSMSILGQMPDDIRDEVWESLNRGEEVTISITPEGGIKALTLVLRKEDLPDEQVRAINKLRLDKVRASIDTGRKLFECMIDDTLEKKDDVIQQLKIDSIALAEAINLVIAAKKSERARINAIKSNAETYALRAEVIEYWKANIDSSLSADKAAAMLAKQFPLSHRKLSQYVAAEKKLLRASKM